MDIQLDAESQPIIDHIKQLGPMDVTQPLEAIRLQNEVGAEKFKGDFIFSGSREDQTITAVDSFAQYGIPVTILKPSQDTTLSWKYIMIFFHGGGFTLGSRNTHMKFCEMISHFCKCVVVNVEYRLSPEHKFPACYVDAEAVARWCLENKKNLAGNDSALVGVAGDSAGANISASVCHLVKGLDFQILIYALLDTSPHSDYSSMTTYGDGFILTRELLLWFSTNFFNKMDEAANTLCSPIRRDSFTGLPPALIIVSEIDPLADQSTAYNEKLIKDGVRTQLVVLKRTIHGFAAMPGHFKKTTEKTVKSVTEFISKL